MSLKASRTLSKMDDISEVFAGVEDDCGCSCLGLVSLMTLWMVCKCPEGALFKIWESCFLKPPEVEENNPFLVARWSGNLSCIKSFKKC